MTNGKDSQPMHDLGKAVLNGTLSDDFLEMLADCVRAERKKQVTKWGGTEHDDTLSVQTWREVIVRSLDKTFERMEWANVEESNNWLATHNGIIEALTLLVACLQSRTRLLAKEYNKRMPIIEEDDTQTWEDFLVRGAPFG